MPPAKVWLWARVLRVLLRLAHSGAVTYAFDVRPEVAEQVESMGAEFVYLDFEEEQQDGAATEAGMPPYQAQSSVKRNWQNSVNWRPRLILLSPRL